MNNQPIIEFLAVTIPVVFTTLSYILIKYDRNQSIKEKNILWLSRNIFRDNSGVNDSAARIHQAILGFTFIFCVGIAGIFIIGLLEEYF